MTQRISAFSLSLSVLLPMAWATIRKPRPMVRYLIDLRLPAGVLWLMLMAVATLSVLIGQVSAILLVPEADLVDQVFLVNPLLMASIQWGAAALTVLAMHHVGTVMGGRGALEDSIAALAWLQFVMLCARVALILLLAVAPPGGQLASPLIFILLMWLFTNFVAEVHGFDNLALVFVMILVTAFAMAFALTIVASILGLTPEGLTSA